jgi:fructose-bisphosphate aldolase class I
MNSQLLKDTAKLLFADHKGLLAMDESNGTCNKRFEKLGIPQTVEARRAYRELIVTTPGLGESIGGAILYDETIRQQKSDGTPFLKVLIEAGITPISAKIRNRPVASSFGLVRRVMRQSGSIVR